MNWANNRYLTFQDMTPEGRKTKIIEVIAVRDGTLLGLIQWYGPWRQYVFAPEPGCIFNPGCLETITANTALLTKEHRLQAAA